jgi:ethanolamine transporter
LTCIGLAVFPKATMKLFSLLSKIISLMIAVGLAAGIFSHLTGLTVIPRALPLMDAILIIGEIVIVLAGVFPLLFILKIVLKKPFKLLGKLMGMSENGVFGLFSSLANSVVTFNDMDKMTPRDRAINMAFAVSASFVFADHLAFTMSFDSAFVGPMIAGKLISGVLAVAGASLYLKRKS